MRSNGTAAANRPNSPSNIPHNDQLIESIAVPHSPAARDKALRDSDDREENHTRSQDERGAERPITSTDGCTPTPDIGSLADGGTSSRENNDMSPERPTIAFGLGRPRRYSLTTASRLVSNPFTDRSFSGGNSSVSSMSPNPNELFSSPENSPNSSRSAYESAASSFISDPCDPSATELPLPPSPPSPLDPYPPEPTSQFLGIPKHEPPRFSSFSSSSSFASDTTAGTADSDYPFQYRPPALPLPPARPERPLYGKGTLPELPSPLLRSPPVEFRDFALQGIGTAFLGARGIEERGEGVNPLGSNPSCVEMPKDSYTFPPTVTSNAATLPSKVNGEDPFQAGASGEEEEEYGRDEMERRMRGYSLEGSSDSDDYGTSTDPGCGDSSQAIFVPLPTSSPSTNTSNAAARFAQRLPGPVIDAHSYHGNIGYGENVPIPFTPRSNGPAQPRPPPSDQSEVTASRVSQGTPTISGQDSSADSYSNSPTPHPTTPSTAVPLDFNSKPNLSAFDSNPISNLTATDPRLSRTRDVPSPNSLPSGLVHTGRRDSIQSATSQGSISDVYDLYHRLPHLERLNGKTGLETSKIGSWGASGLEGGLSLGNGFQGGVGIGMGSKRSSHRLSVASVLSSPSVSDDRLLHADSPEPDYSQTVAQLNGIRSRAIGLQARVEELETALRISKMQTKRAEGRAKSKEMALEKQGGKIEDVLLDLGIDVDETTPIFLSPAFVSLPNCPHCKKALPKRKTNEEGPSEHLVPNRPITSHALVPPDLPAADFATADVALPAAALELEAFDATELTPPAIAETCDEIRAEEDEVAPGRATGVAEKGLRLAVAVLAEASSAEFARLMLMH
ncbi:hypothetical protein P7C70_g4984, partial [Phenoliferia sp. Uapishka_3]